MKKEKYLKEPAVASFLEWVDDLVGGRRRLAVRWHSLQGSGFYLPVRLVARSVGRVPVAYGGGVKGIR